MVRVAYIAILTAPVLKAGPPLSCSYLMCVCECMLCVGIWVWGENEWLDAIIGEWERVSYFLRSMHIQWVLLNIKTSIHEMLIGIAIILAMCQ